MTDLRALLGDDRYDDVMFRAMSAVASQPHGKPYTMRERVADTLAAVLPDLLAEAWDAGWFTGAADIQIRRTPRTPNPYRQDSGWTEAGA